jgi:GT2 family glycosyltransferase
MIPDVSVIIVNFNTEDYLVDCIGSIYEHTKSRQFEIIVVDNASEVDPAVKVLDRYPLVRMVRNTTNRGFGAANNAGAAIASGRYLFFLNPDTILLNDCIGIFFDFLNRKTESSNTVCCGGNLVMPNGRPTTSWGNLPSIFQLISDTGLSKLYDKQYRHHLAIGNPCDFEKVRRVPYITGADLFMDKEVFLKTGGFDERFFMYYEDADLFYKLNRLGYHAYILPEARIQHHESMSTSEGFGLSYHKYALLEKGKYLYFRKNHGALSAFLVKGIQLFTLILHGLFRKTGYTMFKTMRITLAS